MKFNLKTKRFFNKLTQSKLFLETITTIKPSSAYKHDPVHKILLKPTIEFLYGTFVKALQIRNVVKV